MYSSVWLSNIIERFQSGAYFFNMGHVEINIYIDIFLLSVKEARYRNDENAFFVRQFF